jgi:hypothetical protein
LKQTFDLNARLACQTGHGRPPTSKSPTDPILKNDAAVRAAVVNVAQWNRGCGFANVVLEIANESGHGGFNHTLLKTAQGQVEPIASATKVHPNLLVFFLDTALPSRSVDAANLRRAGQFHHSISAQSRCSVYIGWLSRPCSRGTMHANRKENLNPCALPPAGPRLYTLEG